MSIDCRTRLHCDRQELARDEVFDDLIGGLLGQMHEGIGCLIDGEHGTTIEITLYGFFVPEG